MPPLNEVREIIGAVLDQHKGSLGQGGKARRATVGQPWAGWTTIWLKVVAEKVRRGAALAEGGKKTDADVSQRLLTFSFINIDYSLCL
jgi:hypothetical protein